MGHQFKPVMSGVDDVNSLKLPPDKLDSDAVSVCRRLQQEGFVAYLVGGCVRDILLGSTPKDFDVGTSATPAQVRRIFRNCRLIGRRFRLAHVHFGPKIIEVATFRGRGDQDAETSDEDWELEDQLILRSNVYGTPDEDARSRDFTINALFYDPIAEVVIDNVGGYDDVCRGVLRTIGPPIERFKEDPVRMLRAVKFAARLGLTIDDDTMSAISVVANDIHKCPIPRVTEEVYRILESRNPKAAIQLLSETRLLSMVLPELDAYMATNRESYEDFLEVANRMSSAHYPLPRNFVFTLIMYPLFLELLREGEIQPSTAWGPTVQEWFRTIGVRMHVAVRHRTRMRSIMTLMGRFLGIPRKRNPYRVSVSERQALPQALTMLRVHQSLYGGCEEIYERWRAHIESEGLTWVPVAEAEMNRRKQGPRSSPARRRRRRRRPSS